MNASLVRRVLSLVFFFVFAKIFYSNLPLLLPNYKSNFNGYLFLFPSLFLDDEEAHRM
jgi:hypothetical protein